MRHPASRCSPGKVPHWRWWRRISLQVNYTAQTATIRPLLGGTRSYSGHSFLASKRPHYVLRVHLPRNQNSVCFCAIESSISWQFPGLPILLLAAISLTKSSCRITNKRRLGRGNSRDCFRASSVFDRRVARRRSGPCFVSKPFCRSTCLSGEAISVPAVQKALGPADHFRFGISCRRSESGR